MGVGGTQHPRAPGRSALTFFLAVVVSVLVALGPWNALTPASPTTRKHAAKVLAVHANTVVGKYAFVSREWDLARIRRAFNAVIVASVPDGGDAALVRACAGAGLRVYIEFDKKREYAEGKSITATVDAVIKQVRASGGAIAGIRIADRLNEFLDPQTALGYLQATGGMFHARIPGVQVLVDANDWQLTCGVPGQSSCAVHLLDRYRYERDDVLRAFYRSGYVDGFLLANNLMGLDPRAQARAWRRARAMFPSPFVLLSADATLSFPDAEYPYDASRARRQTEVLERIPLEQGADGVDLWAWHRPWNATLRTFMNKDGTSNPLWASMIGVADDLRDR